MNIKSKEDFDKALKDENWNVRLAAVRSEHFGPEHMSIALSDENWNVRVAAVKSEHFGPEHMDIALNDGHDGYWNVRLAAALSEFLEAKHMEKALRDKDWVVIIAAMKTKKLNTYCYIKYLDDIYKDIYEY